MRGLVMIDRSLLKHPIVGSSKDRKVMWIWMLCAASWKPRTLFVSGNEIPLDRGQLFASVRTISSENDVSKGVVERFLRDLRTGAMIETESKTGGSVITICNYDKFQNFEKYRGTAPGTARETETGQRWDKSRTRAGHKRTPEETPEETPAKLLATSEQPSEMDTKLAASQSFKRAEHEEVVQILSEVCSYDVATEFVAHRRELKKPLSIRSANAMAKKLKGHSNPDAVFNDSIANGYQGIFPEKSNKGMNNDGSRAKDWLSAAMSAE